MITIHQMKLMMIIIKKKMMKKIKKTKNKLMKAMLIALIKILRMKEKEKTQIQRSDPKRVGPKENNMKKKRNHMKMKILSLLKSSRF